MEAPYRELYFKLFNKLTDISQEIEKIQSEAEEIFIQHEAENILHL